jgi:hypothetical protein
MTLYYALVRSKLEDVSVACDSINLTDSSKFERIERKFSALRVYDSRFPIDTSDKHRRCGILDTSNLPALQPRSRLIDVLFLISAFKKKLMDHSFSMVTVHVPTEL